MMTREEISKQMTAIFNKTFHANIVMSNELTANDVDGWDSLTHMLLISEVENGFNIKFKLKELNKIKNVGDLIDLVQSKTQE